MRDGWFSSAAYGDAFASDKDTSIFQWIFNHINWFYSALKRLASSAKIFFNSTFTYGYAFATILGPYLAKVMQYTKERQDLVPLRTATYTAVDLLEKIGKKLSDKTRANLQSAIDAGEIAMDTVRVHNDIIVNRLDNKKHTVQYENNRNVADLLTQCVMDDEVNQTLLEQTILFYNGGGGAQSLLDMFVINHETVAYLETQCILAIDELLSSSTTTRIGVKANPAADDSDYDSDEEETEKEEREKRTSIIGLQESLALAETRLDRAESALTTYEAENGVRRDDLYMLMANRIQKSIETQSKNIKGDPLNALSEENMQSLGKMLCDQTSKATSEKYFYLFYELSVALKNRNYFARKLKRKIAPATSLKGNIANAASIVGACCPFLFYACVWYYNPEQTIFTEKDTFESDEVSGWAFKKAVDFLWRSLGYAGLRNVNIMAGVDIKTWAQFLIYFKDVSPDKFLDIPHVMQYFSVAMTSIPVSIAFALFAYSTVMFFGSALVDWWYGIGKNRDGEYKLSQWAYYSGLWANSLFVTFGYSFTKLTSLWIGLLTSQMNAIRSLFGAAVPVLFSGIDPVGRIVQTAINIQTPTAPIEFDEGAWLKKLLPSEDIRRKIAPIGFYTGDPTMSILLYNDVTEVLNQLPATHPLLTGESYMRRMRQQTKELTGGSKPTIEEEQPVMPKLVFRRFTPAIKNE
jgi:hypothetical protein